MATEREKMLRIIHSLKSSCNAADNSIYCRDSLDVAHSIMLHAVKAALVELDPLADEYLVD
jgi:hypothetical protein